LCVNKRWGMAVVLKVDCKDRKVRETPQDLKGSWGGASATHKTEHAPFEMIAR